MYAVTSSFSLYALKTAEKDDDDNGDDDDGGNEEEEEVEEKQEEKKTHSKQRVVNKDTRTLNELLL